jgi:tRNA(fMet)-specific endonuclease VapC
VIRVLLDTTVLIDLSREPELVFPALRGLIVSGGTLGVCAISVAEFFAGVPRGERHYLEDRIADFEYWDISWEAAVLAGMYRFDFARQGIAIQITDALMAATAVTMNATLVTNNVKDFPMAGLRVVPLGGRE